MSHYGYIYKITIPTFEGNRYYYGMHKTEKDFDKNYWGSGKKLFAWIKSKTDGKISQTESIGYKRAIELGLEQEILCYADTAEELYKLEEQVIAKYLGQEDCWNLIDGGKCPITCGHLGHHLSNEAKAKISKANSGKKHTKETKMKMPEAHKGQPSPKGMLGKHMSKESIEKANKTKRERGTNKHKPETIEKLRISHRNISDETRHKMRESAKKRIRYPTSEETKRKLSDLRKGENNPAYGRHWWNNGIEQKYQKECPGEGWVKGRIRRKNNIVI